MPGPAKGRSGRDQGSGARARPRAVWTFVAALAGLFAFTSAALANHAGEVDRSFGDKGFAFTHPGGDIGRSFAVALGRKDKPVLAGETRNGFGVVRYTRHGQVDSSFGGHDGVKTTFGPAFAGAQAVDVGTKGVVVAAGARCHQVNYCNFALAKYRSDGRLDKGFGDDGRVELSFGNIYSAASSVAFTSKGILIAGSTCPASFDDCKFALARLLPNGDPDPSFGPNGNGKVVTRFQDSAGDPINVVANAMAIDSRGRIAVGGGSQKLGALALYDPRGRLVSAFGQGGRLVTDRLPHLGAIAGLAVDAKDKIVAVGLDKKQIGHRWALVRFGKSGGLDRSFGNDGGVVTGFPGAGNVRAFGLAIDSKNRIVVSGEPRCSLARYQPNGNLNRSFGHDGRVTKDRTNADAVAIDSRDRPVVSGDTARFFVVGRFLG